MRLVNITVIAYAPTAFYHCQHCELAFQEMGIGERLRRQEAAESLPDDLGREFGRLSDWIRALVSRHGRRVHLDVVDAVSVRGFLTSLRHGVFRYPAVIVDGEVAPLRGERDLASAEAVISAHVGATGA
jgi:hypothetical protein